MRQYASDSMPVKKSHSISTLLPAGSISCTQCGTWTRTRRPWAYRRLETGGADDEYRLPLPSSSSWSMDVGLYEYITQDWAWKKCK